ncbi:SDR family oxidoreductase [Fulvivirga ligni]|uniref:SDR family oxidoreductase n=1 Tax=Fulvivirga ligni TaxID=2904246 RepID=UPI001F35D1C6|nr:SDR family oxidoreductase [Fulvivirga ligni]UII19717.1 SDR family oxidoreductase [Fulvivirga ligni]
MNVLILGATSDIAIACAEKYLLDGHHLSLAARNADQLQIIAKDIEIRHNKKVDHYVFDALDYEKHDVFYNSLQAKPDIVVWAIGILGDQEEAQASWETSRDIIGANYSSAVSLLNIVANDFESRKSGIIVGIGSVAGDRGRQSNYIYGSTKAAFEAYLSGMRNRLVKSGVHVLTVKPGFVDTKMTAGMDLPKPLTAKPEQVAIKIVKAARKKKNVIYVLPVWRLIMLTIKLIPEGIFKKLKL